jgi:hypothetical protein
METKRLFSTLARQIEAARSQAGFLEDEGDGVRLLEAIFRSLRVTYLALSTGLDPWKDTVHAFVLEVKENGDHVLHHGGHPVPVNSRHFEQLFWYSGIELLPGQVLLLDPELAKQAVEEALGRLALEHALAERERALRKAGIDEALTLPREEDLDALQELDRRTSALWERKIELVAASLVADELLERDRSLSGQDEAA